MKKKNRRKESLTATSLYSMWSGVLWLVIALALAMIMFPAFGKAVIIAFFILLFVAMLG